MTVEPTIPFSKAPLIWLALGTFAIGTEGFMIAPLLPNLASDLSVSISAAGQLVAVFAFTYAISSPILTALTGSANRRSLLIFSMIAFALSNIVAWHAHSYVALMEARVLLAFAAGLYVPSANALAGAIVAPERRGSALAIVNGGTTIAVAIGAPLAAVIGHKFGWRMTFAGVGMLTSIATLGLLVGLRPGVGAGIPVASLRDRINVVRQPTILLALLVTFLWALGAYVVYTYLTLFVTTTTGIGGNYFSLVLLMWGIMAAVGIAFGGRLTDRFGARSVILPCLLLLAVAFVIMSLSAAFLAQSAAAIPVLFAIALWGLSAWAFFPAQATRLMGIAGLKVAPVVLSLNASFMYIGFSSGAAVGSLVVATGSVTRLGWVGAVCEVAALGLMLATTRLPATKSTIAVANGPESLMAFASPMVLEPVVAD